MDGWRAGWARPDTGKTHEKSRRIAVVALPRQPYASVVPVQWQSAIVVPPTYTCAIMAQSSGQNATAVLPRQPCADVAPVQ